MRYRGEHPGVSAVLLGILLAAVIYVPEIICMFQKPDTLIGRSGLEQAEHYCFLLVFTHLTALLLIPLVSFFFEAVYKWKHGEALISLKFRIPIVLVLMTGYALLLPRNSAFRMQLQNRDDSAVPLVQAVRFWADLRADLESGSTTEIPETQVKLDLHDYVYKSLLTGRGKRRATKHHELECGICRENGSLIAQISMSDGKALENSIFPLMPHSFHLYEKSGLVADIDGKQRAEFKQADSLIELTFDYDRGILQRELLCEDEDTLPDLILRTAMDGEMAGSTRINGMTVMPFKPMIPGHAEAWVEMKKGLHETERVSNLITYDQTEYVAETLPDRGPHHAELTETDGKPVLHDETYGFSMTLPAESECKILDQPAGEVSFGSNRDILRSTRTDGCRFELAVLKRPWFQSYSDAVTLEPGVDNEASSYHIRYGSNGYTLKNEERRGEWRVQYWKTDQNDDLILALYPLTELQYLRVLYLCNGAEQQQAALAMLDSLHPLPS